MDGTITVLNSNLWAKTRVLTKALQGLVGEPVEVSTASRLVIGQLVKASLRDQTIRITNGSGTTWVCVEEIVKVEVIGA